VPRPLISRNGEGEALRLPLRWIAILRDQLSIDLAATGGVHSARDALKLLMVGANVTMLASELLLNGADRIHATLRDLEAWLEEREYEFRNAGAGQHEPSACRGARRVRACPLSANRRHVQPGQLVGSQRDLVNVRH